MSRRTTSSAGCGPRCTASGTRNSGSGASNSGGCHDRRCEGGEEMSDPKAGLIHKYRVERVDKKPVAWCFVLEGKDPLAIPALRAYALAARAKGYVPLADDLERKI